MRVILFKLLGASLLAGSLVAGWFWLDYRNFATTPMELPEDGLEYVVEPGKGLAVIGRDLEGRGLLASSRYLIWMGRITGSTARIKAGTYQLTPGTTPEGLLKQLVEGKVAQFPLTLVEGWSFRQVLDALARHPRLKQTLTGLSDAEIMSRLGYPGVHPEGRFYPDTYRFPQGFTDVAFLQRAYRAMEERLAYEWERREEGLPYRSAYEGLIMASIVEKETGLASERPAIAGVFVRRLQKRMRLQTDPTVIYGLGLDFDGNLRRRDLENHTPYNTYRIRGLPPTPIAMPGGEALHAAFHPAPGNELYFVARGDGSHHFSATLEEHNAAVVKYQLKGRRKVFSSSK
ncbi:MAG: endolytic transglycosylase MltG [Gammaproteobacteria bacterium]|nr:endolytic transglycosylase MltG [Gammaproteobacteria bacterium]